MSTAYARLAPVWDFFMTVNGFSRGLSRYIARLPFSVGEAPRCLDVGCGTGVIAFALAKRFPRAAVLATDFESKMLREAVRLARKEKLSERVSFARADINAPEHVSYEGGVSETLTPESFDIIVASGVLEYADFSTSLPRLVALLAPGGYLVTIPMQDSLVGEIYGKVYDFTPIRDGVLYTHLRQLGCTVEEIPLRIDEFPANITRTGIFARKQ